MRAQRSIPRLRASIFLVFFGWAVSACSQIESPTAAGGSNTETSVSTPTTSNTTSSSPDTDPSSTNSITTEQAAPTSAPSEPAVTASTPTTSTPTTAPADAEPTELLGDLTVEVVATYPHDPEAFTQGLLFHDGQLIEGTGLYGSSGLLQYTPGDDPPHEIHDIDSGLFGAGITIVEDSLIQLTWREGKAVIHDVSTLEQTDILDYTGEGWGLCNGDEGLVMSDGTSSLSIRDVDTLAPIRSIAVTADGQPVDKLNELECVDGYVWANRWLSNEIFRIDPSDGTVVAVVDASSLVPAGVSADDVLNGIAYSTESNTFFLTGKRWSNLYEVKFASQ